MTKTARLGANYWRLWTASVISNFGDGLATVAYPWLASAITRDPVHIALIGVATRLPWLIFSLPAGVITDRVDRRKLIASMDTLRFAITLGVATFVTIVADNLADPSVAAGTAPESGAYLAVLYVTALAFGCAEVLRDNAAQTLMPSLVDKPLLEKANGRLWGAEMVMNSFVGPPLGGLLIGVAFALPFFVNASTFAISALLILSLAGAFKATNANASKQRPTFRADISEGVRWLWSNPLLRSMAIILGGMNALTTMALATYVLFVQEILELEASSFGILLSAGAFGGVIGSVLASRISEKIGPGASLFTAIAVSGATMLVTGLTSSAVVVWAMFVLSSFTAVMWNVITVSLRQTIIPDHLLGRVNSVYRFFAWGMMPIGGVLGGVIVSVTERLADRELALRAPFWAAAAIFVGLYVYALPNLNTARIRQATEAVEPTPA